MSNSLISENLILPLSEVCVDPSTFRTERPCCPTLFIAPMLTGKAEPNFAYPVPNYDTAVEYFGEGSVAADMAKYYFLNYNFTELFITGLTDTGVKTAYTVTVTGTAQESGYISLRVGDDDYYVSMLDGDTFADVIDEAVELINSDTDAIVTASVVAGNLVITAKNGGTQGNDIPITWNTFYGEELPDGISITVTVAESGSVYDLDIAIENLGECCYDFIGVPFNDPTILQSLNNELNSRWNCSRFITGRWYSSMPNTDWLSHYNFAVNTGDSYRHGSMIMNCPENPFAAWRQTAAFIGRVHDRVCRDPSAHWYNLQLIGIRGISSLCNKQCFDKQERNTLALNGITTTMTEAGGGMRIELESSLSAKNIDDVWRYPQTAYQVARFAKNLKNFINENYSNVRIVDDIADVIDGEAALTIEMIVGQIQSWAISSQRGLIENTDNLSEFIVVERNYNNPYRVDMAITIDVVNALRLFAVSVYPQLRIIGD